MRIIILNVKDASFIFIEPHVANVCPGILYILCVKFTLELATKAQRWSRGITLLFLYPRR